MAHKLPAYRIACWLAIAIFLAADIVLYSQLLKANDTGQSSSQIFPDNVAGWIGSNEQYDARVLGNLGADQIVYKKFCKDADYPCITLFIAYYKTLDKADLSHSPVVCFTGQGWKITEKKNITFSVKDNGGKDLTVNKLSLQQNDIKLMVFYWYQSANEIFVNKGIQKLNLLWQSLKGKSQGNAFVRITIPVQQGMTEQETTDYIEQFMNDIYPELVKLIK